MSLIAKGTPESTLLKELILYVAHSCALDPNFGAVKLNKILFYSDFLAFLRRGRSITNQHYFALGEGPAPHQLKPARDELKEQGLIVIQHIDCGYAFPLTRIVPMRKLHMEALTADDLVIVNEVIERLKPMNGREVSDLSHKFAGWKIAFEKGTKTFIPYESALLDPQGLWDVEMPPLPESLVEYGRELAARYAA